MSVSCSIHGRVPFSLPLSFPSFPSLPSLLLACCVCVHVRICGPLIPSPPSLSPRVSCLCLHSWWHALLPPLPCSLARIHNRLSLPCTMFAFMAGPPLESPLCLVRIHDPSCDRVHVHDRPPPVRSHDRAHVRVLCWPMTPSPLPVPRDTCQVCDWHSHPCSHPLSHPRSRPCSRPALVHDTHAHVGCPPRVCVHGLSCLHSRSLALAFMVPCARFHGPSRSLSWSLVLAFMVPRARFHGPSHLLSQSLTFAFTVPHVHVCGHLASCLLSLAFAFVVPCVCIRVHDQPLTFAFTTPLVFVPLSNSRLPPSLAVTCVGYLDRL
jgi:hypothetical protein